MKILAVTEFDPAGVLGGHRKALQTIGIDYRLAIMDYYPHIGCEVDWQFTQHDEQIRDFAAEADIIQFHPAIGQPWSYNTLHPQLLDGEDIQFAGVNWQKSFPRAKRVSYFHGSRNAVVNAKLYAEHWRSRGHSIWASTLDYVHWMDAVYAPPALGLENEAGIHTPRTEDDPLIIAHAPTDPLNCHTVEFMSAAARVGAVSEFMFRIPRTDVHKRKKKCNAGFDHLRGSFSVNTLENCFFGLAPLVGVKREYLDRLEEEIGSGGISLRRLFPIETLQDLERTMARLENDPDSHYAMQNDAVTWAKTQWNTQTIATLLKRKYEAVLA